MLAALPLLALLLVAAWPGVAGADTITVGTIERAPFVMTAEDGELSGFSVELWDEIASQAGIDYEWKLHQQFADMVDTVVDGAIDMVVANISITAQRERLADFSQPIFESGMAIGIKAGATPGLFQLVIQSGALYFLGGALLLIFVVANIIWFFERGIEDPRHDYFRDDYFGGVWDAFWWAFIIMTMGGFENEAPHKVVNRIIAMFWIVLSLFFVSTLTAKITTALTVAELKTDIDGYEDLKGKRVGVTTASSHETFLNARGISTIGYADPTALFAALNADELDAIVADEPIINYAASTADAGWLTQAGSTFKRENYGILLPEGSPLRESIDEALLTLHDDGRYEAIRRSWFGADN